MSIAPLASLAAAAAGTLLAPAAKKIAAAVSFADVLAAGRAEAPDAERQHGAPAGPSSELDGGSVRLDRLQNEAEAALARFRQDLLDRMAAAGIRTSLRFRLEDDGLGGVAVAGDHPKKESIERLFLEDPALTGSFRYLSATLRLLRTAREQQAIRQQSAGDPMFGPGRFSGPLGRGGESFGVTVNGDEVEATFR